MKASYRKVVLEEVPTVAIENFNSSYFYVLSIDQTAYKLIKDTSLGYARYTFKNMFKDESFYGGYHKEPTAAINYVMTTLKKDVLEISDTTNLSAWMLEVSKKQV